MLIIWWLMLAAAIGAAHWGADQVATPLQKVRDGWGLSGAAGAAIIALATASPEIGTNTFSAVRDVGGIGLGNLLGSNIISVPAIVLTAYVAVRTQREKHMETLPVKLEALTVQAIPYLLLIALVALLSLPAPWRGLQPIDALVMLVAYGAYVAQAFSRYRQDSNPQTWQKHELVRAALGMLALALGAYATVFATEKLVTAYGIGNVVGGLLITATMSIVPEVFATWSVARSGQVTAATTSVIADNSATLTLALVPLALVNTPVDQLGLFALNLGFVALFGAAYALALVHNRRERGFERVEVSLLVGLYAFYIFVMALWFWLF